MTDLHREMELAAEARRIAERLKATISMSTIAGIIDGLDGEMAKRVLKVFVYERD